MRLGRVYTYNEEETAAIDELRTAIDLNPSFALAHYGMAVAMVVLNRPDDAKQELDTAVRLSPHDPVAWQIQVTRSMVGLLKADYPDALEWARKASRRHAKVGFSPYALMAAALGQLGQRKEAERALDRALAQEPRLSYSFLKLAWPWMRHDRHENYFEGLRKAGLDIPDEPAAAG